jgi:hypothetical protein
VEIIYTAKKPVGNRGMLESESILCGIRINDMP